MTPTNEQLTQKYRLILRKRAESPLLPLTPDALLPLTSDAYYINKGQDQRQN